MIGGRASLSSLANSTGVGVGSRVRCARTSVRQTGKALVRRAWGTALEQGAPGVRSRHDQARSRKCLPWAALAGNDQGILTLTIS